MLNEPVFKMTLYAADCIENAKNTLYKNAVTVNTAEDMKRVLKRDHMASMMRESKRGIDNFLRCDCIMTDIDNTHSKDPDAWKTADDICDALPVNYVLVRSRNYMKEKREVSKGGKVTIYEPREKWHVYLPLASPITSVEEFNKIMHHVQALFPFIDSSAKDAARFFFGVKDPHITVEHGGMCIDEFIGGADPDELQRIGRENLAEFEKNVQSGFYNDDKRNQEVISSIRSFLGMKGPAGADARPTRDEANNTDADLPEWLRYAEQEASIAWVERWAKRCGVPLGRRYKFDTATHPDAIAICVPCPWEEEHSMTGTDNESVIIIEITGKLDFLCRHSHGGQLSWKVYRAKVEADAGIDNAQEDQEDPADDGREKFHLHDKRGNPSGVFDYAIHQHLKESIPMFILGGVPYLYEGGVYEADSTGAMLKSKIRELIYPEFIKAPTIKRVFDLFLGDADLQVGFEDLNQYPPEWICFRNGFYDPANKVMVPHDPKYRAINQIPHEYEPDADPEGGTVKSWLQFIAEPEEVQMLLEYVGYCMTRDTRQQRFLILAGEGGTGKSTVIRMLESVIGEANISNVSLNQLNQRFAPYNLLGKLLNSCADLEVTALEDTSILKKILGEDRISAEAKGKDMFSFKSCAKLIFSTNELPIVKSEKTNGFYRRLLILTMNRKPKAVQSDFFEKLDAEIDYFIHAAVGGLEQMYQRGTITEPQSSLDAVERLRCDSDSVAAFLRDCTEKSPGTSVRRTEAYHVYCKYCGEWDRQTLTRNNFYRSMLAKNCTLKCIHGVYFYADMGITVPQMAVRNSYSGKFETVYSFTST